MAAKKKTKFMCQSCGYESAKWMGKCPGCGEWNKMVEETEIVKPARKGAFTHSEVRGSAEREKATPITTIQSDKEPRITTDLAELNRALGGGIVQGSLVLIGGDPGIGKSTLLLQVSAQLAHKQKKVLYISGEESIKQLRIRFHPLPGMEQLHRFGAKNHDTNADNHEAHQHFEE